MLSCVQDVGLVKCTTHTLTTLMYLHVVAHGAQSSRMHVPNAYFIVLYVDPRPTYLQVIEQSRSAELSVQTPDLHTYRL